MFSVGASLGFCIDNFHEANLLAPSNNTQSSSSSSSSSSSLHGLGEAPVPASGIVPIHLLLGLSMSRFTDG
jgi:hypothetical protein